MTTTVHPTGPAKNGMLVTIAEVKPAEIGGIWYAVVKSCPFCGKQHRHGASLTLESLRADMTLRVSHCNPGGSYALVESGR